MTTIRVIDFETTGMEPPAEVCEVGYCDLTKDALDGWAIDPPVSWLCGVSEMPPEVMAIHHITMRDVAGMEPFSSRAFFEEEGGDTASVIAAHNYEFEAKFLGAHGLPTLCTYKAALRVWPDAPSHSNSVLRYWLEDQGLISLDHETAMPPHRAGPDAYVTAHILRALLAITTAREMVAWTREPRLLPRCPIGKFRGKPWAEVEGGFLNWMISQPTMEYDLKWNARRELDRRESA